MARYVAFAIIVEILINTNFSRLSDGTKGITGSIAVEGVCNSSTVFLSFGGRNKSRSSKVEGTAKKVYSAFHTRTKD